jgi:DNA repair protein RecO (recombination protein O)
VLNKSLKEEEGNPDLFEFLYNALLVFDHLPEGYENFHLQFMIKLSRFLGFAPQSAGEVFEQVYEFIGKTSVSEEEQEILGALIQQPFTERIRSSNQIRRLLLDDLVKFYQLHIDNFADLKSTAVLREMME